MNFSTKNHKHLKTNIDEVSKTKILVTAANGNTGFPAAKELLNIGFDAAWHWTLTHPKAT